MVHHGSTVTSLGNTRPSSQIKVKRISPSKSWCFTLNNYTETQLDQLVQGFKDKGLEYVVGREVGSQGTPHLQGYIKSNIKFRPMEYFSENRPCEYFPFPKCHWEKCKGNKEQNWNYCTKDGNYVTNMEDNTVRVEEPWGWQLWVKHLISQPPDNRTIHWFWDDQGNMGKSTLVKWLCVKHDAQVCAGKAGDMKCQIASCGTPPKIVVFDVPRSNLDYISYTGIEEIKNGCFSSPKYESRMYCMNHPHVIVFANEPPNTRKLSLDRWHVVNLRERGNFPSRHA